MLGGEVIEVRDNGSEVWALSYVDGKLVNERVVATVDSAEGRVRDYVTDLAAEGFVEVD
ncbi:hypothetical protein ACQEU5_25045 [Marinactinospora thermotolerans]|uniref:hypothetical protein n=1 Tax=Marinactinospora thermotolerans TaxID=531310 RepID=UPI003D8BF061